MEPEACRPCHAAIAARYAATSMANSVRPIASASNIEQPDGTLEHSTSGRRYRVDRVWQKRTLLNGDDAYQLNATHTVGSGKHARSYLHRTGSGELVQLPLSWYTQENRWHMSPGYDAPKHFDFTRAVDPGCLFCHTAYPVGAASMPTLQTGVDCQRCHGPGSSHIAAAASGKSPAAIRQAIVNLRRITDSGRRLDVCLQCHLQSTSDPLPHAVPRIGRSLFSFRPGEPLSRYAVHLERKGQKDIEINSHGYRMISSTCFKKSAGRMECISCHDPHGEESAEAVSKRTQETCRGCHEPHRDARGENCASCHMPKSQARDAVHVSVTDHWPRSAAPLDAAPGTLSLMMPESLSALERKLYLGMASVEKEADIAGGIALLRQYLAEAPAPLPEAWRQLGKGYDKSNDSSRALSSFSSMVAARPPDPVDLVSLGDLLLRAGRPAEAEQRFRQALPLPQAHLGLGNALLKQKRAREAVPHWKVAAGASVRTRSEAANNLAVWELVSGNLPEAKRLLNDLLAFDPSNAEANLNLCRVLAGQGDLPGALRRAERAVAIDPTYPEARFNRGRLLHALEQRDEAIADYREAIRLRPTLGEAHFSLGVALAEMGRYAEAKLEFMEALRLEPRNVEAKRNLELTNQILRTR